MVISIDTKSLGSKVIPMLLTAELNGSGKHYVFGGSPERSDQYTRRLPGLPPSRHVYLRCLPPSRHVYRILNLLDLPDLPPSCLPDPKLQTLGACHFKGQGSLCVCWTAWRMVGTHRTGRNTLKLHGIVVPKNVLPNPPSEL